MTLCVSNSISFSISVNPIVFLDRFFFFDISVSLSISISTSLQINEYVFIIVSFSSSVSTSTSTFFSLNFHLCLVILFPPSFIDATFRSRGSQARFRCHWQWFPGQHEKWKPLRRAPLSAPTCSHPHGRGAANNVLA